jgi:hypothetical protein
MYHYNLERLANSNPPTYVIRAARDTVILSESENFVFTATRIRLAHWVTGTIKSSIHSVFHTNSDIEIPPVPLRSSEYNLVVQVNNSGPLDLSCRSNDIIAEVILSPHDSTFHFQRRQKDLIDVAIFSKTCEKLRLRLAEKRRQSDWISTLRFPPEEDIWSTFMRDIGLEDAMDEEYQDALRGQASPILDIVVPDPPQIVQPIVPLVHQQQQILEWNPVSSDESELEIADDESS